VISITCTNCKTILTIDEAFAGGVCRCQHSGTIQTVPAAPRPTGGLAPKATAVSKSLYQGQERSKPGPTAATELAELADAVASSGLSGSGLANRRNTESQSPAALASRESAEQPLDRRGLLLIIVAASALAAVLIVFVVVSAVTVLLLPRLLRLAIRYFGHRISEPEIKLLLVVLFGLGGLATQAGSEAVLPAYVAGLVVAGVFLHDRVLMDRLRSIAFALLTPFYFLKAGLYVSLPAVATGAGLIALLLATKLATKGAGVWPVSRAMRMPQRESVYTTLLMSTGLTFGTISSLYGLNAGIIDRTQLSLLVTVLVLSAVMPTFVAERSFLPDAHDARRPDRTQPYAQVEEYG